jgi:hypothetical protein
MKAIFIVPLIAIISILVASTNLAYAHTKDYWSGYKVGQLDGKNGIYDPAGSDRIYDPNNLQFQHWLQGYKDGYKSICGNLNSRMNPPCSSPPT